MAKAGIENVSDTALWVATYRADETDRVDSLFQDPLADLLIGERGREIAKNMTGSQYAAWSVVIRTRIIDTFITDLVSQGIVETVLNLGAGLDTRPYRMDLPATLRWVEVDFPHMIEHKEIFLKKETSKCQLERIKLDLSNSKARLEFFGKIASESKKILVLTEGVVPYLNNAQVGSLSDDLRAHESFRYWILDYFSPRLTRYIKSGRRLKQMRNAPFQFLPTDWFGFFSDRGWKPKETRYLKEESERLGRHVPIPWFAVLLKIFLPSKHRKEFEKFAGYVLLEPGRLDHL